MAIEAPETLLRVDGDVLEGPVAVLEVLDDGATLDGADAEAVVNVEEVSVVIGAAVDIVVVVAGAVVEGAVVLAETWLAVLSKQLQALETLEGSSLPTHSGRVLSEPARNFGQNAAAWVEKRSSARRVLSS